MTAYYPEAQGVDVDHKTYLSLNIVMGSSLDQKQTMALKVLTKVLLKAITPPCALPSCGPVSAAMYQAASMPPSSSPFFLSALAAVRKVKKTVSSRSFTARSRSFPARASRRNLWKQNSAAKNSRCAKLISMSTQKDSSMDFRSWRPGFMVGILRRA